MSDGLETRLRSAFAEQARQLPAQAEQRLRAIDYQPRSRTLDPRLLAGASAGLAATGGAIVAIVGLGAGASPAFAGWSATPTTPASGETAGALERCTAQLAQAGAPQSGIPAGGWQPVLTDTRGPFTAMILTIGNASATCFSGPAFTTIAADDTQSGGSQHAVGVGSGSGVALRATSVLGLGGPSSGPISQASQEHLSGSGGQPYTFVQGQVPAGATAVTIGLSDATDVAATVADGSFVAWWPGNADAVSAQVTDASGVTSQQLQFTALPGPGGSGSASLFGGASSSSGSASSSSRSS